MPSSMPVNRSTQRRWLAQLLTGACGILLAVGCSGSKPEETPTPAQVAVPSDGTPPPPVETMPSDDECRAFAEALLAALAGGDAGRRNVLFDSDACTTRALQQLPVDDAMRGELKAVVATAIGEAQQSQHNLIAAGGRVALVKLHQIDGRQRILLRELPVAGGIDYCDFLVEKQADGQIKAIDVYDLSAGEYCSQAARRAVLAQRKQRDANLLSELDAADAALAASVDQVDRLRALVRQGRLTDALATEKQLPADVRALKPVMLLRAQAARERTEDMTPAVEEFRVAFPGDAGIDLVAFDYYVRQGLLAEALACLGRIDDAVQGDNYLNIIRSSIHFSQGEWDAAARNAERAIAADPDLSDAYWCLLSAALKKKDHATTAHCLTELARLGEPSSDLTKIADYADFVQSPEYARWHAQQAK